MRILIGLIAAMLATSAAAEKRVVTADRYLDVATGRYVEHPAIFIGDDGRITSIGRPAAPAAAAPPRRTWRGRRCR